MRRGFVRFRRKHRNILAPAMIVFGLLLTLICVPFWAFMALIGAAVMGAGVYFLLCR